jgi:hypothetical protein
MNPSLTAVYHYNIIAPVPLLFKRSNVNWTMKKIHWLIGITFICLAACFPSSNNVYQSEAVKGVNYKNYKTYAWLPTKEDTSYNQLVSKKVVESALVGAVSQQLSARGMVKDTVNPDCLFTYTLVLKKTYTVGNNPPPVYSFTPNTGPDPGQYNMYYWYPSSTLNYDQNQYTGGLQVSTFRDGALLIDMIDRKENKIVWRTSAQGSVNEKDRQGVRPTINQIIPIMFKKFPVKP